MITRAEIEKLGALHVVEPVMLSLYLATPPPGDLAARAGELMVAAEAACPPAWRRSAPGPHMPWSSRATA